MHVSDKIHLYCGQNYPTEELRRQMRQPGASKLQPHDPLVRGIAGDSEHLENSVPIGKVKAQHDVGRADRADVGVVQTTVEAPLQRR